MQLVVILVELRETPRVSLGVAADFFDSQNRALKQDSDSARR